MIGVCCDVIGWSCGRLERANWLGTHGGAGGDFGSVVVRVFNSRIWFGQMSTILLCTLSLTNSYPFHIVFRGAIVAKEISQRDAFVAISCDS